VEPRNAPDKDRLQATRFAGRPILFGELQADDVRQFITDRFHAVGNIGNAIAIATTLRADSRSRTTRDDAVQSLLAGIAFRRHRGLPEREPGELSRKPGRRLI